MGHRVKDFYLPSAPCTMLGSTGYLLLARIFHELLSRDHEDGLATWQPQGVGSEAYLKMLQRAHSP